MNVLNFNAVKALFGILLLTFFVSEAQAQRRRSTVSASLPIELARGINAMVAADVEVVANFDLSGFTLRERQRTYAHVETLQQYFRREGCRASDSWARQHRRSDRVLANQTDILEMMTTVQIQVGTTSLGGAVMDFQIYCANPQNREPMIFFGRVAVGTEQNAPELPQGCLAEFTSDMSIENLRRASQYRTEPDAVRIGNIADQYSRHYCILGRR